MNEIFSHTLPAVRSNLHATIFAVSLLLCGCIAPGPVYKNDAYQVKILFYNDGTCELTIDSEIIIDTARSEFERWYGDESWECKSDDVFVYAQLHFVSSPEESWKVKGDSPEAVDNERGYLLLDVLNLIGGDLGRYKPGFERILFGSISLQMYESTFIYNPTKNPIATITGVARRGDSL